MNVPLAAAPRLACCSSALRVHHDRPVPGDRLLDRLARDQQEADALVAGLHDDFVAADRRARAIGCRRSDRRRRRRSARSSVDHVRLRRVAERAGAREHVGERVARSLDRRCACAARRHRHVEVARDRRRRRRPGPLLPQKLAADDAHARAVVVGHLGDVGAPSRPDSAASVILSDDGRFAHSWKPCMRPCASPFGISWCRMPLPAVIHCTSPAPSVPRLPRLSPCSTSPAEHVGDGLDAAMRMPREAGQIVVRVVVAEVVEQQERIEVRCCRSRTRAAASRRRLPWWASTVRFS